MPNGTRRHQDNAEELESREHLVDRRQRHRKAKAGKCVADAFEAQAAEPQSEQVRTPPDQHAGGDCDETRGNAAWILHSAEPAREDDGEADQTDLRRHVHFERGPHRNEGDRDTGKCAEQCRSRRDPADVGRDEAADHQDETLEEHPDEAGGPALHRIAGFQRDRQHDHERDDEHVRHTDARRQRADVVPARLQCQPIGKPRVVKGGKAHHQAERRQDAAEYERIRHLQHEAQQPGEHQHVDEDVGAEPEERIPVSWRPQ